MTFPHDSLPADLPAEAAVLGSLLIDSEAFPRIADQLRPEDFHRDRHQRCYAAAQELFRRDEVVDQVTLARELQRRHELEAAGGMAYLSQLVAETPTSTHIEYYAQSVLKAAQMRQLISAGQAISALGYNSELEPEPAFRQAEETLFRARGPAAAAGFVPLKEVYDQFLQERADQDADPAAELDPGAPGPALTGYDSLDLLLGGMQNSDLLILGGRPGMGKSALAVNIGIAVAQRGQAAAIFSLEMSKEQLGLRILAAAAGVSAHAIRTGLLSGPQDDAVHDAVGALSDLPFYIADAPAQTLLALRGQARRQALSPGGLSLLIVDYLQLIQGAEGGRRGRQENRVQEISEISRGLKALARDLNRPLIVCSQLSRQVENRPGHRPLLSDLRDSGSIEQDADVVMFLYRPDQYWTPEEWQQDNPGEPYPKDLAELIVAKHRNGPTGTVPLRFQPPLVRFDALEPEQS